MSNNQIIRVVAYHFQTDCEIQGDRLTRMDSCPDQAQILSRSKNAMTLWWPKYRTQEYLHRNPATDEWILLNSRGGLRFQCSDANAKEGTWFVVSHEHKTVGYLVTKNACSTLFGTTLHEHNGFEPRPNGAQNPIWGDSYAYSQIRKHESYDAEELRDYRHIIPYRNPIDRFVNLCNYAWCIANNLALPYTAACKDKRSFIETMLLLIKLNDRNYPDPFEVHMQSQYHYFLFTHRIDTVVRVEDFSDYIRKEWGCEPYNCNVDVKNELTVEDLIPEDIERLKQTSWGKDWLIPQYYGNLFYKNANK
ncbi:MAG: hypothetical protein LUE13_06520 [Akkermansiaceae bacterium]|nr:hypothetical protein [Akkermansiaceae bacterium]